MRKKRDVDSNNNSTWERRAQVGNPSGRPYFPAGIVYRLTELQQQDTFAMTGTIIRVILDKIWDQQYAGQQWIDGRLVTWNFIRYNGETFSHLLPYDLFRNACGWTLSQGQNGWTFFLQRGQAFVAQPFVIVN
jgi:hypothetical protein